MNENRDSGYNILALIKKYVLEIFDISDDTDKEATIEDIKSGIYMKGQTAWVLIFSILIASTGLNTSSTAVVIGAMLISPLMGPILGMGLSLGINDIDFLRKALKNFGVMVVLSLITSFLFFSIPMFQNETPELIARTFPDVRDVIIALSGGLALIVALSRRNKSLNTIAGVAIATALMPPLCTAGYGLATGKWDFFRGAMFLFTINTIFIASATFLVVRFLKFPYEAYANSQRRKRISQVITIFAIGILVPSIYMFYQLYRKSNFDGKVDDLMQKVRSEKGIIVLDLDKNFTKREVSFSIIGKSFSNKEVKELVAQMGESGFEDVKFKIMQDASNLETLAKIKEMENSYLSTQQLLVKKEEMLLSKDREIIDLKNQISNSKDLPFNDVAAEIKTLFKVDELSYANTFKTNFTKQDTIPTFQIKWNTSVKNKNQESEKLQNWLRVKTKNKKVKVVSE
ncbi:MAG: putative hydrophobic protein (TIGR00271 family) [Flavobacterium sp.]|jgi:uncharacterized hydrophobic protein (TIGR00271 family)